MTLQELGSLGELLASIRVLVSLVFVGVQLRHNALATKASKRQSIFDATLSFHTIQIDPSVLAQAQFKLRSGQEISDFELDQVTRLQHMNLREFENRYYQHKQGMIDEEMWFRSRSIIWAIFNLAGSDQAAHRIAEMWSAIRPSFPRDFIVEVENIRKISPEESRQLWVDGGT